MHIDYYEKIFLWLTVAMLAVMLVAIGNGVLNHDITVATPSGRIDPLTLDQTPPFDSPGVVQTGDNTFDVTVVARKWQYQPNEIHLPEGAVATFYISSPDIIHGYKVVDTNINIMVLPGEISRVTQRFDEAREHLIVCHEYCGTGHQAMFGRIIVGDALPSTEEDS